MTARAYVPKISEGEERGKVRTFDDRDSFTQPAQDLNGRSIVNIENGERIGHVSNLLFDPESLRVVGLVSNRGNMGGLGNLLTRDTETFPASAVEVWGKDVILVHTPERMIEEGSPEREKWVDLTAQLKDRYVVSVDGTRVGQVGDVILDKNGQIVAYSLNQVYVEGPLAESKRIPAGATHSLGKDVLIVDMSKF